MDKLKPCPFCGYTYPLMRKESGGYISISCENCNIHFRIGTGAKERIKELWNMVFH